MERDVKKKDVLNLIRYHADRNEKEFNRTAYMIAEDFSRNGDVELAEYIIAQISPQTAWMAQDCEAPYAGFFRKVPSSDISLPLPESIMGDIQGLLNAVSTHTGVNRFLFSGKPGSGKTECVKHIARILKRDLFVADFEAVIDSRLGQTAKNISKVFEMMHRYPDPDKAIFLFDEIDSVAMDRIDGRDVREMGRATSAFLRYMDNLDNRVILIATTNLASSFDKAFLRRFDYIIDFDRYSQSDLKDVAEQILSEQLTMFSIKDRNIALFRKIIGILAPLPYPGDLKNIIRTSIAFSDRNEKLSYLKTLFRKIYPDYSLLTLEDYRRFGFTVREIEFLSGIPKSTVSRILNEGKAHEE